MSYSHITKDGQEIALEDLSDSHLDNIIAYLERLAKSGVTVANGGGSIDSETFLYDESVLYGADALEALDYDMYIAERNRRQQNNIVN